MDFATRLKIPARLPQGLDFEKLYQEESKEVLLGSMGISHIKKTKVGNEYIRGVSGGERKWVSVIECLATNGSIFCWDNGARGLNKSSALNNTKAICSLTDNLCLASIVTLNQAGNGIYDLFDKVILLDDDKQIFYGLLKETRPFMEDLGFVCEDGANVADYLTKVIFPTERKIRGNYKYKFPRNTQIFLAKYQKSSVRTRMISKHDYPSSKLCQQRTKEFIQAVAEEKNQHLPKTSTATTGLITQVRACVYRQY